jgi:hypothetical protein
MDYYAFLDENNVVTEVIGGKNQGSENVDWEKWYGEFRGQVCKRSTTDGFRKNYAGVGYTYDSARDAFIPPQPFPSWVLNEEICQWGAPIAMPADGKRYTWNESTTSWDLVSE